MPRERNRWVPVNSEVLLVTEILTQFEGSIKVKVGIMPVSPPSASSMCGYYTDAWSQDDTGTWRVRRSTMVEVAFGSLR